ncbi:hypothetical protein [Allosalinactinospora lopnorensis]|uniref:hypothetical protein n=1 Tax=Allosalinactinospora lopnorensis TaxID=1352348 RepID=UPI0012E1F04F|nr:hypothetical protein [Allosalinactinospora lopnorensis]
MADWRRWCAWCERNQRSPLPAHAADVALYLASASVQDPTTGQPAPSTIERWSAAIAAAHTARGLPTPTTQEPAAAVLAALRRRANSGRRLLTRALNDDEFTRLLGVLPLDTWPQAAIRRRDRLILTLGRATGLPPDAFLGLSVNSISQQSESTLGVATDAENLLLKLEEAPVGLAWESFLQWRTLLDLADSVGTSGLRQLAANGDLEALLAQEPDPSKPPEQRPDAAAWLFRSVRRGGAIQQERPHSSLVMRIVQKYAHDAELDSDGLNAFSLRPPS